MRQAFASAFVVAILATACGGGSSSTTSATPTSVLEVAGPRPSASAQMICATEAQGDIAASVGIEATSVSKPKWNAAEHVYSCSYTYGVRAQFALSVKELSSKDETTTYFDALGTRLGRGRSFDIAQGSFQTTNGSLVVRKDYKVLLIDVSALPEQFGEPTTDRASVAVNIATVIMACWSGA